MTRSAGRAAAYNFREPRVLGSVPESPVAGASASEGCERCHCRAREANPSSLPAGVLDGELREPLLRFVQAAFALAARDLANGGEVPFVLDEHEGRESALYSYRPLYGAYLDARRALILALPDARRALALAHRGYVLDAGRNAIEGGGAELLQDSRVTELYLGGSGTIASSSTSTSTPSGMNPETK